MKGRFAEVTAFFCKRLFKKVSLYVDFFRLVYLSIEKENPDFNQDCLNHLDQLYIKKSRYGFSYMQCAEPLQVFKSRDKCFSCPSTRSARSHCSSLNTLKTPLKYLPKKSRYGLFLHAVRVSVACVVRSVSQLLFIRVISLIKSVQLEAPLPMSFINSTIIKNFIRKCNSFEDVSKGQKTTF